jgi:demethylmenaquinone methyltransferase/2-methoxy-6-polyprenyl-1,4-benzoquinol methylase
LNVREYEGRIKLKFKLLASFYDLFDIPFRLNESGNPRLALARKIPNANLRILDACVGTANGAIAVSQENDRNEIIGIDLSPDMIAVAEEKIRKQEIHNISIRQMDATKMSFQDGEFDIVMISFALHELDYELMTCILKEMSRVVKDSGLLYIIDYEREDGLFKSLILSIHLKILEPRHITQFLRYDWHNILQGVGFRVIDTEKYLFSKLISAVRNSV